MRKINRYLEFITESKLDLMLENIAFSSGFKMALDKIEPPLSTRIKELEGMDIDVSTNFIEVNFDKEGVVRFIPDNKLKKDPNYTELINGYLPSEDYKRSDIKIGRFVRRLLNKAGVEFTDVDIEEFVNKYKAYVKLKNDALSNIDVVKGDDIKEYYLGDNYSGIGLGTLGNSCMRYEKCQKYLNIYSENPEKVSLIILRNVNNNDKIDGRALLWELSDGKKFMDRIYKSEESQHLIFIEYAKRNDIYYKDTQNSSSDNFNLMLNEEEFDANPKLVVELPKGGYSYYPYMDTLKYFDPSTGILSNEREDDNYDILELEETNGGDGSCQNCGGSGEHDCYNCDGEGEHTCYECDGRGTNHCHDCDGEGEMECGECWGAGDTECGSCDGTGDADGDQAFHVGLCSDCDGEGRNECAYCNNGSNSCDECDGDGDIRCDDCSGEGVRTCYDCGGEGTRSCYDC